MDDDYVSICPPEERRETLLFIAHVPFNYHVPSDEFVSYDIADDMCGFGNFWWL